MREFHKVKMPHLDVNNNVLVDRRKISANEITINETKPPICGRKCKSGCLHGRDNSFQQDQKEISDEYIDSLTRQNYIPTKSDNTHLAIEKNEFENSAYIDEQYESDEEDIYYYHFILRKRKIDIILSDNTNLKKKNILKPCNHPDLIVIQDYLKEDENEVTVESGEYALLMDDETIDGCICILNEKNEIGYIPEACIIVYHCHCNLIPNKRIIPTLQFSINKKMIHWSLLDDDTKDSCFIAQENYVRTWLDELDVNIGDFLYLCNAVPHYRDGYLIWVHSPKQKMCGYVPYFVLKKTHDVEFICV